MLERSSRASRPKVADHGTKSAGAALCNEQGANGHDPMVRPAGNFGDRETLIEQLVHKTNQAGDRDPASTYVRRKRVGKCPASHNRALLD